MAEETPLDLPLEQPPAARHYAMLCLLMLLVVTVLLAGRVPDVWSALPLLFGAALLVTQWREGPAVVLFLVACLLASEGWPGGPLGVLQSTAVWGFRHYVRYASVGAVFDDFLLAGAFLIYAASYYRYLGFCAARLPRSTHGCGPMAAWVSASASVCERSRNVVRRRR